MKKIAISLGVLGLMVLVSGCNLKDAWANRTKSIKVISQQQAQDRVITFIKGSLLTSGADATVKSISDENGLYKISLSVTMNGQSQDIDSYVSKDGQLFFPSGAMNIDEVTKQAADAKNAAGGDTSAQASPKDAVKTDKPVVDLYVMSFCPYGTQMEKGIIPVVQTLGSKITFNLKFVSYTMHGDKEQNENMRQYCIEKNNPAKYLSYLQCFLKTSAGDVADAEKCMATAGIAKSAIDSCISETATKFSITAGSTDFPIYAADNTKYGVQGSPTLVINGVTSTSGRDSASILKAVCGSFKTAPAECKKALSTTAPSAGFGDGTAAAGASAASCATPTN